MIQEFNALVENPNPTEILRKKSDATDAIITLQQSLNELGFGAQLRWEEFGADGDFGNGTAAAIQAFGQKNNLPTNGEQVTPELAAAIADKLAIVDSLRILAQLKKSGSPETSLFRRSGSKRTIIALQTILNHLGFGNELNWARFGADGDFGGSTSAAVKAFADKSGIAADGSKFTKPLLDKVLETYTAQLGDNWEKAGSTPSPNGSSSNDTSANQGVMLPTGFKPHKKGVYTIGNRTAEELILANPPELESLGLSQSTARVMVAVSVNEGNLDAINTWDNSYMTFGMFQWTIGAGADKGELPAMLLKVKKKEPEVFQKLFGQYGLDISERDTDSTYGYFKLDGDTVRTPSQKEELRANVWALRFFEAGQDPVVQAVQIAHAADRLKNFYWKESHKISGHLISDLITSEFGVALLLDNHVNRPGYVKTCVEKAFKGMSNQNPDSWQTEEEKQLIEAYLRIRETHPNSGNPNQPMTDAKKRAERNIRLVNQGKLSSDRGSFVFDATRSRSIFDTSTVPAGYRESDYPDIIEEKVAFEG